MRDDRIGVVDSPVRLYLEYEVITLGELASITRAWDVTIKAFFREEVRRRGTTRLPGLAMVARRVTTPSSSELIADVALAISVFNAVGGPLVSWKAMVAASVSHLGSAMTSLSQSPFLGGVEPSQAFPELPPLRTTRAADLLPGGGPQGDVVIASGATVLRLPVEAASSAKTVKHVERLVKTLAKAEVQRVEITASAGNQKFTLQKRSDDDL